MRLYGLYKLIYWWLILLVTSGDALAVLYVEVEKAAGKETEIGEVDLKKTTSAYSVIHADDIEGRFTDLSSVIKQEVGVQLRTVGGFGSFSTAQLRGASSQQVVVYLDGVSLIDASTGAFDLSSIPVDNIDRIEIYRGVTPIELSSASIGGAINIITKKAGALRAADLKVTLGSLSTKKLSASYNNNFSSSNFLMTIDYLESENDYEILFDNGTVFNKQDDFLVDVNNNQVKDYSLLLKWNKAIDSETNVDFRFKLNSKNKNIPSVNNSPDVTTSYSTDSVDLLSQVTSRNIWSGLADLNIKLDYYTAENVYDDRLAQQGFFDQLNIYETQKVTLQSFLKFLYKEQELKLLIGAASEDYKYKNELRSRQKSKNTRDSVELGIDHRSYYFDKNMTVSLAYRFQVVEDNLDHAVDIFDSVVEQSDKKYTLSDPQLGVRYQTAHNVFFTANIGQYSRVPLFYELFGDQGVFRGNNDLQQETSINTDIGFNYEFYKPWHWLDETTLYLGLFHNLADNLIVREFSAQGIGFADNVDSAVIKGFEFQLITFPLKKFNINFNMSLLDSIIESPVRSFDGNRLPGQFAQNYNLLMAYKISDWQVSLQQDYRSDLYVDRSNSLLGEDVYTADISFYRRWEKHSFELRINNVTDTNYYQVIRSRPLPGTVYLVTYQYYFNEVK